MGGTPFAGRACAHVAAAHGVLRFPVAVRRAGRVARFSRGREIPEEIEMPDRLRARTVKKAVRPAGSLLLLLVFAALGASCADGGAGPQAKSAPPEDASPRRGGELRLNFTGISTLDPALTSGLNEAAVTRQIFDGLVELDEELRIVPEAALAWDTSEDRRTFRFRLRPGMRFHDGSPVEAADFLYSFERLVDPRVNSPAAAFFSVVEGVDAHRAGRAEHVSGLRAPESLVFEITLNEPYQPFLEILAMPWAKVVPRRAVEAGGFGSKPVGSGPFRFASREPGAGILLAANDSYVRGRPLLDRVVVTELEGNEVMEAFRQGRLDYLGASEARFEEASRGTRYRVTRRPSLTLTFLGFRLSIPELKDVRIRRAISAAIDRSAIVAALEGQAAVARTVLPPGMPGYDPGAATDSFDRERAISLLAEAGHPDGDGLGEFRLLVGGVPNQTMICKLLRSQLARIGISVRIEPVENYERYLEALREAELYVFGWGADFPDPENFLGPLFRTAAVYNFGAYSCAEVDRLLDSARYLSDKVARLSLYRTAERRILADAPIVPLFHDSMVHYLQPDVRGLEVSALGIYQASLRSAWKASPPAPEPAR